MAAFSPTTTQATQNIFEPEAKQAFGRELGFFGGVQQPAELGQTQQLLGILHQQGPTGARAMSPGYSGLTNLLNIAPNAMANAGASRGIHTPEFANALDTLHQSAPQLVELLRHYALQNAQQTQSLIDPRWSRLLFPERVTGSTSESGLGSLLTQGGGTALNLAALLAPLFANQSDQGA